MQIKSNYKFSLKISKLRLAQAKTFLTQITDFLSTMAPGENVMPATQYFAKPDVQHANLYHHHRKVSYVHLSISFVHSIDTVSEDQLSGLSWSKGGSGAGTLESPQILSNPFKSYPNKRFIVSWTDPGGSWGVPGCLGRSGEARERPHNSRAA